MKYKDVRVYLKSLTWSATNAAGTGPYQAEYPSGLSASATIVAITVSGFGSLRREGTVSTSEIVTPYIHTLDSTKFGIISDTNSFLNSDSNIQFRLLYV